MLINDLTQAFVAGGALLGTVLGILKFREENRYKRTIIRDAFASVIKSLSADNEIERLTAAILIRRFFDPKTEVGDKNTSFADDAVNVITSILRSQNTGSFQKILADGLAYAPSLMHTDFQKTNLQNAYLGSRRCSENGQDRLLNVNISYADFYRADLSGASLKNAKAEGAQFYQARLLDTVLEGADLHNANFYGADLRGAKLQKAILKGANFWDARNIPLEVSELLDNKGYYNKDGFFNSFKERRPKDGVNVFVSRPGILSGQHQQLFDVLRQRLEAEDMLLQMLHRIDYPKFGAIAEVQRVMAGCSGVLVLGLRQIDVHEGVWRNATPEQQHLNCVAYSTPWSQIEAGMALMLGLPVLILAEVGVQGGVFDISDSEHNLFRLRIHDDLSSSTFANWCAAVRDRANTR